MIEVLEKTNNIRYKESTLSLIPFPLFVKYFLVKTEKNLSIRQTKRATHLRATLSFFDVPFL